MVLLQDIPAVIIVGTPEGDLEFVNKPGLDYFGRTLEEMKGWATSDAIHPDDLQNAIATWRRSVETGQPYDFDERLRRADGVYRWFHVSGLPLRDPDGRITRWHILATDIHERKLAEEKLREDEIELRRITDAIPDIIHVLDPDGAVLHVNKAALDYSGLRLADVQGDDYAARFIHPEDLNKQGEHWRKALGQPFPSNTNSGHSETTGSIVGFLCVITRCWTMQGKLSAGTQPQPTSRIANALKKGRATKTWRCVRK